jgi:hypothetical protein
VRSTAAWVRAALIGPSLSTSALVTALVALGFVDPSVGGVALNWLYGMAIGAVVALLCSAALMGVDFVFVRAELRQLPVGRSAWAQSIGMPVAVIGAYQLLEPRDMWGPSFFGATLVPVIAIALLLRYTFGEPFESTS